MKTCCTPGCDNELTEHARLRNCSACRSHLHRWDRRRPAEALHYFQQLKVRQNRMTDFADLRDDNIVPVDHATLERKKLASFPVRKSRKKAASNVVAFRLRNRKRKTA
jgi:hypothetical protein